MKDFSKSIKSISQRKLIIIFVVVLCIIAGTFVTEGYLRNRIIRCTDTNLSKILNSPVSVNLGSAPLLWYAITNEANVKITSNNFSNIQNMHLIANADQVTLSDGKVKSINATITWPIENIQNIVKNSIKLPLIDSLPAQTVVTGNDQTHKLDVTLNSSLGELDLQITPYIESDEVKLRLDSAKLRAPLIGEIGLPISLEQELIDQLKNPIPIEIPKWIKVNSIDVNSKEIVAKATGNDVQIRDLQGNPVDFRKIC